MSTMEVVGEQFGTARNVLSEIAESVLSKAPDLMETASAELHQVGQQAGAHAHRVADNLASGVQTQLPSDLPDIRAGLRRAVDHGQARRPSRTSGWRTVVVCVALGLGVGLLVNRILRKRRHGANSGDTPSNAPQAEPRPPANPRHAVSEEHAAPTTNGSRATESIG